MSHKWLMSLIRSNMRRSRRQLGKKLYQKNPLSVPWAWGDRLDSSRFYPSLNLHSIFITKTGCTTLLKLMLALDLEKNQSRPTIQRHLRICYRKLCAQMPRPFPAFNYKHLEQDLFSVAFVRNPYARLVSCYLNKVTGQHFKGSHQVNKNIIDVPDEARTSFEAFVRFACRIPDYQRDIHFASQWFCLVPGLATFDFIGSTEHLNEHAHQLLSNLGASDTLLASIAHTRGNSSGRYDWKSYYTKELADLVYQAYWPDFEAFGYHKDSWKKAFKAPHRDPICNYDPTNDIERFRKHFETEKTEA